MSGLVNYSFAEINAETDALIASGSPSKTIYWLRGLMNTEGYAGNT